jgi:hypothetical protein
VKGCVSDDVLTLVVMPLCWGAGPCYKPPRNLYEHPWLVKWESTAAMAFTPAGCTRSRQDQFPTACSPISPPSFSTGPSKHYLQFIDRRPDHGNHKSNGITSIAKSLAAKTAAAPQSADDVAVGTNTVVIVQCSHICFTRLLGNAAFLGKCSGLTSVGKGRYAVRQLDNHPEIAFVRFV